MPRRGGALQGNTLLGLVERSVPPTPRHVQSPKARENGAQVEPALLGEERRDSRLDDDAPAFRLCNLTNSAYLYSMWWRPPLLSRATHVRIPLTRNTSPWLPPAPPAPSPASGGMRVHVLFESLLLAGLASSRVAACQESRETARFSISLDPCSVLADFKGSRSLCVCVCVCV